MDRLIMDRTLARLNVEHFRKKLAERPEETTRRTLVRLLADEEAKLVALDKLPMEEKRRPYDR